LSRHLLDLNTLLALLDPQHVFHEAAHRWVETTPGLRYA
jgi:predicted nucleic acid-binding protein